jgi:LPXTG-motif cell wall-anchored protein
VDDLQKKGFPLIGVVFLALGVFEFFQGDSWVVWIILGVLFGGLGVFSRRKDKLP